MSKLLEEVRDLIRTLHYSYRTEEDLHRGHAGSPQVTRRGELETRRRAPLVGTFASMFSTAKQFARSVLALLAGERPQAVSRFDPLIQYIHRYLPVPLSLSPAGRDHVPGEIHLVAP